jgi:hypothetical protein
MTDDANPTNEELDAPRGVRIGKLRFEWRKSGTDLSFDDWYAQAYPSEELIDEQGQAAEREGGPEVAEGRQEQAKRAARGPRR